jgi:hypothetical protein
MSVKSRVIEFFLPACLLQLTIWRMIHFIVGCRLHFPGKRILIEKSDMKTAYRRAHLQLARAVECLAQLDGLLFMMLRFTFCKQALSNPVVNDL